MEATEELVRELQKKLVISHAPVLDDEKSRNEITSQIRKFLSDKGLSGDEKLERRLYSELCGFGLLDEMLADEQVEEININSWDDIALSLSDGSIRKSGEHFFNPGHALDMVKKLLRASHTVMDDASPVAYGNLGCDIRITAVKPPVVDESCGVAASIRLLRTNLTDRSYLVRQGMLTEEMADFLGLCLRYGVSCVLCGRTSSGKTTLLNALLGDFPDNRRIFTIESGSREIHLVKRDEKGNVKNNAVHTLTRPSEKSGSDVTQEDLVMASLRFDPDLVCIGEMRDKEAYAAMEASATDHTVLTTVHGAGGKRAHERMAFLARKRFPMETETALHLAQVSFPLTVYCQKEPDGKRRVLEIEECWEDGEEMKYRMLYAFDSAKQCFVKQNEPSPALLEHLARYGCPKSGKAEGGRCDFL